MKKTIILIIVVLFMIIGYSAYNTTINIYGNGKLAENLSDFKVYISSLKVNGNEVSGINDARDGFNITTPVNGTVEYSIINDSTEYDTEASLECAKEDENVGKVWNYDYTGGEQTFVAPATGTYKLETWGAQGGGDTKYIGGYGSYSLGNVLLNKNANVYVNVGGNGNYCTGNICEANGGYNGGGNCKTLSSTRAGEVSTCGAGGGATHIATKSGLLSSLENYKTNILIVSGGGGGGNYCNVPNFASGGHAGGFEGVASIDMGAKDFSVNGGLKAKGGTQTGGYAFGTAGGYDSEAAVGGGSGLYGGISSSINGGGGGSSYIGNSLLTDKSMYCYNCTESTEVSTKTISTTCTSSTPTSACSKQGNGYARVTLVDSTENFTTEKIMIEALSASTQKMENIKTKSLTCKLKVNKISRTEKKTYNGPTVWNYDYTGSEQTFIVPVTGTYKIETWGAQGGSYSSTFIGGYGGYSFGSISLVTGQKLYVYVGSQGVELIGGYNGGATVNDGIYGRAGGGATHIATKSGLLSSLENSKSNILIVSGGGGGAAQRGEEYGDGDGGSAGGFVGNDGKSVNHSNGFGYGIGTGGTQTAFGQIAWTRGTYGISEEHLLKSYGAFGLGGGNDFHAAGGGSGFFGGGGSFHGGAGGGSSYIGNTLLINKSMYCYNCATSNETSTKTISTTCTSSTPTENCAKQGNGYARITLISID